MSVHAMRSWSYIIAQYYRKNNNSNNNKKKINLIIHDIYICYDSLSYSSPSMMRSIDFWIVTAAVDEMDEAVGDIGIAEEEEEEEGDDKAVVGDDMRLFSVTWFFIPSI